MTIINDASSDVALTETDIPALPGRTLTRAELKAWVTGIATRPELWEHHISHDGGERHYASLYRDSNIDVWLLCWNTRDDTGWHDHDVSSGAVVVTHGAVTEANPRMGGEVGRSVSIHAYSPPLWHIGQYAIGRNGVMRRMSVSYADELRPMDDESLIERYKDLQAITDEATE